MTPERWQVVRGILQSAMDLRIAEHCRQRNLRLANQQRELPVSLVNRVKTTPRDAVKESLIGLEFFWRQPGYDPKTDPILRVEGHRLRRRLETYYRTEGSGDSWRIVLFSSFYPAQAWTARIGSYPPRVLAQLFPPDSQGLECGNVNANTVPHFSGLVLLRTWIRP